MKVLIEKATYNESSVIGPLSRINFIHGSVERDTAFGEPTDKVVLQEYTTNLLQSKISP